MSWNAVGYHYCKWSEDGSWERVWQQSIQSVTAELDLRQINLDGSHSVAKKGGEQVTYQQRKLAKTSNILPMCDAKGYIIASTGIVAGNHHDSFELKTLLQNAFKALKRMGLKLAGAFFNADSAFDSKTARKVCFNHHLIPNIAENVRNRKQAKQRRKRLFNPSIYKQRFVAERTFAWIDKFRALLLRFDRKASYFLGSHFIVFALINLRHLFALKA